MSIYATHWVLKFPRYGDVGVDSVEFCQRLLEQESVAVVPGAAFGPSGEGHFRASYAVGIETLDRAVEGIDRFLRRLRA